MVVISKAVFAEKEIIKCCLKNKEAVHTCV